MKDPKAGLSSREAAKRLKQYGPNALVETKRLPGVLAFLSRFTNPLVIILLFAATLSAFLGDRVSFVIIITIVLVSTVLDFINSYRSERAAEALKEQVRVEAECLRDGKWVSLPLAELVPGDVVKLEAGRLIPADGEVIEGKDLSANESSLTGESFPVAKPAAAELFLGSSITSGTGTMLVARTGKATKFSHIAQALSSQESPTEFDREIKDFSLLIIKITTVLVVVIFTFNLFFRHQLLESLLFSVALAVGLTPELLPLIITLNLTKGSLAMAKHGVIIKKLSSIQNLGSMDVLCTDKTGTLTEDHIALVRHVDGFGATSEKTLLYGYIASVYTTGFENPLDKAVRAFQTVNIKGYRKLDEIPYDFERKRESVVVAHHDGRLLVSKGAPEEIMRLSHKYIDGQPFESVKSEVQAQYEALSAEGFRVLGVGIHHVPKSTGYEPNVEHDLTFVGFMAFLDPAKQSVKSTLVKMREYGIAVKIVTGDNALVTRKIADDIGLEITGILTGADIEKLSRPQLRDVVESTTIFARVNPEQKLMIIEQLRANHHVVGYLGDGINDAPALKAADIGISVDNAVDVAKATADLILLRKSLESLIDGVIEGRRTYANTLKYLMMSLGSNFGNMFSMAGGSLFLPFLPMRATQILLTNLLYDTSQFALPLDGVDAEGLKRPRTLKIAALKKAMWLFGPLSSLFDFATFGALLVVFRLGEASFQTGWFLESVATQTFVVYIIRTHKIPFVQSRPSPYLVISTLATVIIGYLIALSPIGHYFGFGPLPGAALAAIVAITVTYLSFAEIVKRQFFKRVDL
ncbi:MAG TPA: magnesium-translocating P-type ATPase [Candidatus Saccharimonadia bacterium]|jgi:Mg2+-importing ATPase|nr:magnesium-translocating P-type ATPase [Candidatus Saccharimonadia bacterium]